MKELASTEFRKTYASLEDVTVVTVNGHPIGLWAPWTFSDRLLLQELPTAAKTSQAQRDDLLRKINRSQR